MSGGVKRSTIECMLRFLRLCVSYEHGTNDCSKVSCHTSCEECLCKTASVKRNTSVTKLWHSLHIIASGQKQCSHFTEVVIHKRFTASMTLYFATVLCFVLVANAECESAQHTRPIVTL